METPINYQIARIITLPILNLGGATFNLGNPPWTTQGFRCVVSGTPGSGKSYLMAVITEEVHELGVPFVVVDPDGEHRSLCELGGVARVAAGGGDISFDEDDWPGVAIRLLHMGAGLVLDFGDVPEDRWHWLYGWFARRFFEAQRQAPQATFFFLEEAHIFAPQKNPKAAMESLAITKQISRRGRKFGINTVFGSQRPADLEKDILAQSNVRFFGRVEIELDYRAIQRYLPPGIRMQSLRDLDSGEFYLSVSGDFNLVRIRERRTADLGATPPIAYRQRSFLDLVNAMEQARDGRVSQGE